MLCYVCSLCCVMLLSSSVLCCDAGSVTVTLGYAGYVALCFCDVMFVFCDFYGATGAKFDL